MTASYADKERLFLESLEEDTGRDLQAWMSEIDRQGLTERDDIIDWLREQGFIFSWASWLERIHHNDGQPIYLDRVPASLTTSERQNGDPTGNDENAVTDTTPEPLRPSGGPHLRLVSSKDDPQTDGAHVAAGFAERNKGGVCDLEKQRQGSDISAAGLEPIVAGAKAYAPLTRHFLGWVKQHMPDVALQAARQHILLKNPDAFAVLAPYSKGLRLGLSLGNAALISPLVKAKFPPPLNPLSRTFTHMILLDDVRQVDQALFEQLVCAQRHVNGSQ